MSDQQRVEALHLASQRLVRTVDAITADEYAGPSLLPGWTRAHVVAHLALNGEGLAEALRGVVGGESIPMYSSQEARDQDIEKLAAASAGALRDRLMGATTDFADALNAVPEEKWGTAIERTPGGPSFKAGAALGMRSREVEIHHADLGLAYARSDWPGAFAALLLDAMAKREPAEPFTAHADDLDRSWQCGDGGPVVTGTAADLGWWLSGRGNGDGLTSDNGVLPRIEAW